MLMILVTSSPESPVSEIVTLSQAGRLLRIQSEPIERRDDLKIDISFFDPEVQHFLRFFTNKCGYFIMIRAANTHDNTLQTEYKTCRQGEQGLVKPGQEK